MSATQHGDADAQALAALGYSSEFKRDMSGWANFSLGFTYLSPVVGIYSLFAVALMAAGPAMIWWLVIVGVGQFLVALVFGEVVSQYPLAGGIYPWTRRLWGRKWAWMAGWVYTIALVATIASVAYGAGPYLAQLVGFDVNDATKIICALVLILLAFLVNMGGTKWLAYAAIIGFTAELLGALVVGGWLLLTERHHGLGVIFESFGAGDPNDYAFAFLAAALIGVFQYYGFEACGDVAEEVPDPTRRIPKAMRMTIYVGGAAAIFVCLSLVLAVEDFAAVISGDDADPVTTILHNAFGEGGTRIVLAVVMLSFLSCVLSLMAAASRLMYSYARDDMIMGSTYLRKFNSDRHVPPYAMVVAAVVPAIFVLLSTVSPEALTTIISFATLGIYIGFQMVVLAALRARLKGWKPSGPFQLGALGLPVTVAALSYGIFTIINTGWPRGGDWLAVITAAAGILIGLIYLVVAKPHERSNAPYSDAIPKGR